MNYKYIYFLFLFILPICLFSQEDERERIVILSFKAINIEQDIADIVTENFITEVVNLSVYDVIERNQLDKVFAELELSASDDFNENTAVEIGKLARSKLVILGSVGFAGSKMVLNARVIDVETGSIKKAEKVVVNDDNYLFEDIAKLAALICGKKYETVREKPAEDDPGVTEDESSLSRDERRKDALLKSKEAKYKKYRREGFKSLIAGSILFSGGMVLGTVLLMYVAPSNFSQTAWTKFYNDRLGNTYSEQNIRDAKTGFQIAYYSCLAFTMIGYILAVSGLALGLSSIPWFVKAFKLKKEIIELSLYGGFNSAGFCLAIRF